MASNYGQVTEFSGNADDWEAYVAQLESYLVAHDITTAAKKRAILLSSWDCSIQNNPERAYFLDSLLTYKFFWMNLFLLIIKNSQSPWNLMLMHVIIVWPDGARVH